MKARILVVDDELVLRRATADMLRLAGYEVLQAGTGAEGLLMTREARPDLVLLDRMLPDIDGLEVCRQIKAEPECRRTLVVHLTAVRVSSDQQSDGLEAGADGYLVRPIGRRELLARVEAFLRIKRAEEELKASEEKFRSFIEQSTDGFVQVDERGDVIAWNRGMEEISGLEQADVLGQPIWDIQYRLASEENRTPAYREEIRARMTAMLSSRRISQHGNVQDFPAQRPDGTRRVVQQTAFPIMQGGTFRVGAIFRDVTEHIQAEQERERLLRDLQQALAEIKTLSGLLPICAWCKKIRDDQGYWQQIEHYLAQHTDAVFSHGLCPECYHKYAGGLAGLDSPGKTKDET
jgi:PAS domain S-box-containing protein